MIRRFPWSALLSMLAPLGLLLIMGLQNGAFYRDDGVNGTLVWKVDPRWFSDNWLLITIGMVFFVGFGVIRFVRQWRAFLDFERFDEDGYLTFATLKEIQWAKDQTANALVSTIEGRDVALKNLPALALRGRDVGDQLPIYALPNKPERVVWAGEIDAPADHVLPAQATDDSSLAARDAQERYDMQVKQAAAEEWLSDFTAKATDVEAVNDAISRSTDPRGSGIDASSAGAIHTKFVRLTFFDFFVIPFFVVHGGIFLTVGLGSFGGGGAPFFPIAGIFALVGLIEMGFVVFMASRLIRKILRRGQLGSVGVRKTALFLGSKDTLVRVNNRPRRALILEIDGQRYQHGRFSPGKIAHLREGGSVEILQNPNDPKVIFLPDL